jgi:2-aminoethylphosphonate-pyruvate transaminase
MFLHPFHSVLLTPGPVTLSFSTKREMLVDYAMDGQHIEAEIAFCREYLLEIANGTDVATAVPLAGSATAANEAAIQTFVPADGKLLVYANGVFGDRLATICQAMRLPHALLRAAPTRAAFGLESL